MRVYQAVFLGFVTGFFLQALVLNPSTPVESKERALTFLNLDNVVLLIGGLLFVFFRRNPLVGRVGGFLVGSGVGSEAARLFISSTL